MASEANDAKIVVFIDSLGDDDVAEATNYIRQMQSGGVMDAGHPYVTPKVMGEIYTGESPGVHGLPSASRYDQDARVRPAAPTLPEIAAEDDTYGGVLNFGLPFILQPQCNPTGEYWHRSDAMGNDNIVPQAAIPHLQTPGPVGDLADPDSSGGRLWNHRRDEAWRTFSITRSLLDLKEFDVAFVGCRLPDSYCHYRFTGPDDADRTDRDLLLEEIIDPQVNLLGDFGDVFVFGDHGATELEDVWKINWWLREKGYLDIEIDEDKIDWAIEAGLMDENDGPGVVRSPEMAGVEIDEETSVAVSADPFSGGITLLGGADADTVSDLIDDLEATEHVDGVFSPHDRWEGDKLDEGPDLYVERAVGTFISSNVVEEMGGAEITRSGVHHPMGSWASTVDIDAPDVVGPQELHRIILEDFLEITDPNLGAEREFGGSPDELSDDQRRHLQDMGYI